MKRVHLRRTAKRDIQEAAAWYRERDPELANRFLDEVYRTLALLEQFPNIGGRVFGVRDKTTRQVPVDTFPYYVVFKSLPTRTAVLAIAHERRRPGYWNE